MTDRPIRVLVAEDSPTARELLTAILETDAEIRVVGCASDGEEAVRLTKKLRPNLVLMDVRMPKMNGFHATKTIMIECPTPIVIVSAWINGREVNVSMEALRMGALAVLAKPVGPTAPSFQKSCAELIGMVKAMAEVRTVRHWPLRPPATPAATGRRPSVATAVDVVAIAASTGGPQALGKLFAQLTGAFSAPILVVQHIGQEFLAGFAQWLNSCTELRVKIAEAGETARKGTVYLPAPDRHLEISRGGKLVLSSAPPVSGFRPAANVLLDSVARAYGPSVLAVILTGMGTDGAAGACTVKAAGGSVIAQDEATSVVFGMPKAAIDSGCVDQTMPLPEIAAKLLQLTGSTQQGA